MPQRANISTDWQVPQCPAECPSQHDLRTSPVASRPIAISNRIGRSGLCSRCGQSTPLLIGQDAFEDFYPFCERRVFRQLPYCFGSAAKRTLDNRVKNMDLSPLLNLPRRSSEYHGAVFQWVGVGLTTHDTWSQGSITLGLLDFGRICRCRR